MSLGRTIYRAVFARTSTAALAVIGMAFFLERGVSAFSDYTFDTINKGVSNLLIFILNRN